MYSEMVPLGESAPDFDLLDANPLTQTARLQLDDLRASRLLLVVFSCNHCPYVKHIEPALVDLAREYDEEDVAFVAVSSNDPAQYPEDSFDGMARRAEERRFPFPYLFDETQDVARTYGAACTPDFFLFDDDRKLTYRGRFDETRPGGANAHGGELRSAIDEARTTGTVTGPQHPSIGCSIKWKEAAP